MKYSIIFTGIVALSSDLIPRGQAANLPTPSTTEVAKSDYNTTVTSKGPEFPVTTYVKKKMTRGTSVEKRKKGFHCFGEDRWQKKGKAHCGAPGKWPCYRNCLRDTVMQGKKVQSGRCKRFCKRLDSRQPGDCTTSSDDGFGCVLPALQKEAEWELEWQKNEPEIAEQKREAAETMKRWKKAVAEWSEGSIQPVPQPQERRKEFDCNGDEPWKKHGKRHCAETGKWPCYRTCLKDTILEKSPVESGKCKKFCKKQGKPQPGDCTSSSDDDFGCNIPILRQEIKDEQDRQDDNSKPPKDPEADDDDDGDDDDETESDEEPTRTTVNVQSLISRLNEATKQPTPTGT